jgi:gamma-glutamylcyclotransferase (GGCT)/AIG2-like uncharacterized protein YtfP
MNKNKLYAFYGSLRKGMYNHKYFESGLEYLGTKEIKGYDLYSLGAFPCIVKSPVPDTVLTVDLFRAKNDATENRIHSMEKGAGYDYEEVEIDGQNFGIYVYDNRHKPPIERLVPGGDWVKYLQN